MIKTIYDTHTHLVVAFMQTIKDIFKLPFYTVRDTKLQSFQFRLLHRIISHNKWLNTIKIKKSDQCSHCDSIDDIPHFFIFIKCPKVLVFWHYWVNWWENISGIEIKNSSVLHICILSGFPNSNPEEKRKKYMHFIIYTPNTIYTSRDYSRIIA